MLTNENQRDQSQKHNAEKKKKMGLFVSIKSIQEGLLRLSKHVSALINSSNHLNYRNFS